MSPRNLLIMLAGLENPFWVEAYVDLAEDGTPELWGEAKQTPDSVKRSYKFVYTKEGWK